MKRIVFILSIFIWVAILVGINMFSSFSPETRAFLATQIFKNAPITSATTSASKVFEIWYGDSIFYGETTPAPSSMSGGVRLGEWLFLISLHDPFTEQNIVLSGVRIEHLAKGDYLVELSKTELRIYAISGLLRIVLSDGEGSDLTSFNMFPTQYFEIERALGSETLAQADIFRLAQLSTIRVVDSRDHATVAGLFRESKAEATAFLEEIKTRSLWQQKELAEFAKTFDPSLGIWDALLEKYGPLFVNEAKKKVLYRNQRIHVLQELYALTRTPCAQESCKKEIARLPAISERITRTHEDIEDPAFKAELTELTHAYGVLTNLDIAPNNQEFILRIQEVLGKSITSNSHQNPAFEFIAHLYGRYFLGEVTDAELSKSLQWLIGNLLDKKTLPEKEFLGFIFFLKEFLSSRDDVSDANLDLFRRVIQIAKLYTTSLRDEKSRTSAVSTFFYAFSNIADKTHQNIVRAYLTSSDLKNTEILPKYLIGGVPNIESWLLAALRKTIEWLRDFRRTFDQVIVEPTWPAPADETVDSGDILGKNTDILDELLALFEQYTAYRTKLTLSLDTQRAVGLEADKTPLSLQSLTEYLGAFAWVQRDSIETLNDPQKDGFYTVAATIFDRKFTFKLTPTGHVIEQVIIREGDREIRDYERMSQSLDDRKKILSEQIGAAQTPEARARVDIRNYFKYAFSNAQDPTSTSQEVITNAEFNLTPQLKLFVQSQLIEKDFALIKETIAIPLSRVDARIEGGEYRIRIVSVPMTVSGDNQAYKLSVTSGYMFTPTTHAFANMEFTVQNDRGTLLYGGVPVQVLPALIDIRDFPQRARLIAPYLQKMNTLELSGGSLTLDLESGILTVNGITTQL